VRLSAGRETMNDQMQALAFMAGANSVFYGDKLLTTPNPAAHQDQQLFARLGINKTNINQKDSQSHIPQKEPQFYNACA
jgi:biotin synthase